MCDKCDETLEIVGMACDACGMYMKSYFIPTVIVYCSESNRQGPTEWCAFFQCKNCGHEWSLQKTLQ